MEVSEERKESYDAVEPEDIELEEGGQTGSPNSRKGRKGKVRKSIIMAKEELEKIIPNKEDVYPWANVILIAITIGCVEYFPAAMLAWSIPEKYEFLDWMISNYGVAYMMLTNVALCMTLVCASVAVTRLVPVAAGSGIPNLIGYLYNGKLTDPMLLSPQMVFIKMLGVCLALTGGLPIGREGPAIHIGAGVGDICNTVFDKILEFRTGSPTPFDGKVKSNVVMMGITAGFASAFRSPMGGMLYCIEEIAPQWDIKSHMTVGAQTFLCAAISAYVTDQIVRATAKESGSVQFSSIIIFEGDEVALHQGAIYHNHDYAGFLVIALLSGLLSGVTTHMSIYVRAWRYQKEERTYFWRILLDAALIAAVTAVAFSLETLLYRDCKHVPYDADDDSHRRLAGGGGGRQFVQYNCDDGDYSELASLSLTGEESVIRHLLSRDEEEFEIIPLIIFFAVYVPLSVLARALPLPMGSFVPNLLIGSLLGRIVGEICEEIYPNHLISEPGVYALIGAAAMLAGWTRTMIAVPIILIEISGDVGMTIPLIGATIIARGLAIVVANHSFSHHRFYQIIDDHENGKLAVLHPNDWEPPGRKRRQTIRESLDSKDGALEERLASLRKEYNEGFGTGLEMVETDDNTANLAY